MNSPHPASKSSASAVPSLDVDVVLLDANSGAPLEEQSCSVAALQEVEGALKLAADGEASGCLDVLPGHPGHVILRLRLDGSVGAARELKDRVLSGDFEIAALQNLSSSGSSLKVRVDRSSLAEHYEESVLALECLTPHQEEKLEQCSVSDAGKPHVHLQAPAGAGKTHVALHRALELLRNPEKPRDHILFVARNEALSYFAASWIGKRLRDRNERSQMLSRLHMLSEPFEAGVHTVEVSGNRIVLRSKETSRDSTDSTLEYSLLVIDEAHHVYSDGAARACVEAYFTPGKTERILLSDISQSLGRDIDYPADLRDVVLSEVVRCSKRIVAGAMAFQLGGQEKLLTKCHHESTGPPLKSFLFDVPASPPGFDHAFFSTYAEHIVQALEHVVATFPDLGLHNRLAIVVPDAAFKQSMWPTLSDALSQHFANRRFCLVNAVTASSDLGPRVGSDDDCRGKVGSPVQADDDENGEWIICDTIGQLDGLERLIVIGVGLDSIISKEDTPADTSDVSPLQTRSMLYRAVTRAHLMFLVVNEFLRGGWLEFLGSVRLHDDEAFNSAEELRRTEVEAVEEFVKTELAKAISTAAKLQAMTLDATALSMLASSAATLQEAGFEQAAAVRRVLQSWTSGDELVHSTMQTVAQQASLHLPEDIISSIRLELNLALQRGETANLAAAAHESMKQEHSRLRDAEIKRALQSAAAGRMIDTEVLAILVPKVSLTLEQGEGGTRLRVAQDWANACQAALDEWWQTEARIEAVLQESITRFNDLDLDSIESKNSLRKSAVSAICRGEAIEKAVNEALHKTYRNRTDALIDRTLEQAMENAIEHDLICSRGVRVRLSGLQSQPSLNGTEGTITGFDGCKQRWKVQLDNPPKMVSLKESSLVPFKSSAVCHQQCPLSEVMTLLRNAVNSMMRSTEDIKPLDQKIRDCAECIIPKWRNLEAQIVSALEDSALERQLHLTPEDLFSLTKTILLESQERRLWMTSQSQKEADETEDDPTSQSQKEADETEDDPTSQSQKEADETEDDPTSQSQKEADETKVDPFTTAIATTLDDWEEQKQLELEDVAEIAAAIEAKAKSERLMLTDAAASSLQQRVASALRRGETLEAAVAAVLRDWHRQLVRRQVQQTVWDPSGNSTRKVTGVVRFMPFKQDAKHLDYLLLSTVFTFLPFQQLGAVSHVSKRWRNVASDPSWKPELVAYAWGSAHVTGLSVDCPKPTLLEFSLAKQVMHIACADAATFALTETGALWFWGRSWLPDLVEDCSAPTRLDELSDVVSVTVTPAGYSHGRSAFLQVGYSCAAVTRRGDLYSWGVNATGNLFHRERQVKRPRRVTQFGSNVWDPATERVLQASMGQAYLALCVERPGLVLESGERTATPTTSVITSGSFLLQMFQFRRSVQDRAEVFVQPQEWLELRGIPLRHLKAGSFHCCAVTMRGELYTFGDMLGLDHSNGNLLGHGPPDDAMMPGTAPRRVLKDGLGPIAEVACSTYSSIAVTVDGRVFSWGDHDGDALGHPENQVYHSPTWLKSLRWQRVAHGSLSYTNGAVATDEGRVFVWGGNAWQGGIASGRNIGEPSEVRWSGVPSCYRCTSVALGHNHGYLIFRKLP